MVQNDRNQDLALVRKCLTGSEEAWQEFYSRFIGLIRSVVKRQIGFTSHDSQDLTQTAFVALAGALGSYTTESSLAHFVCMITERALIDEFRKSKAAKRAAETRSVEHHDGSDDTTLILPADLDLPDVQFEKAEAAGRLNDALLKLDGKCRELLTMRFYKDLSYGEISEIYGTAENTLTVQTRRCIEKLKLIFLSSERKGMRP
jgi:RNA polymerase sigma-70 factor (ECF subfamily)